MIRVPGQPSDYAGKTVKIRAGVTGGDGTQIGGQNFRVEDWWINLTGRGWGTSSERAAWNYATRILGTDVPADDDVLYGKVGNLGYLVHVSEIEATA